MTDSAAGKRIVSAAEFLRGYPFARATFVGT